MLAELRVRDFAVIADVSLQLSPGLNVLTGETGAGKSLIVDALALLLGERASASVVRPGAAKATVEGAFALGPSTGPIGAALTALGVEPEDGLVVVKREVAAAGGSRAWVNGSPTAAGVLAQLGALLVDLHGQHETQSLLHADTQRDLLDAFGAAALERAATRDAHGRAAEARRREAELEERRAEVRRKADYLRHVVDEITAAAPRVGEDDALDAEARRLAHAEELARLCQELERAATTESLARATKLVSGVARLDPTAAGWQALVDAAYANLEELAGAARDYAGRLDAEPGRLREVEARRDVLYRLKQKYGPALADVLAQRDRAAHELDVLDTAELDLRALAEARAQAEADLARACAALGAKRRAAAREVAVAVTALLPTLGMPGGSLVVTLTSLPGPAATGTEAVAFEVQLNPGLPARPLARVASGGELSRLMLALKVVLADHDAVPTLVFDEVDQGIGGEVGARVGEALARVARGERQVLVITHLPQIAARAANHLVVAKGTAAGIATSDVQAVSGAARARELARMLGDADLAAAQRHAAELLKTAGAMPEPAAGSTNPPAGARRRR